MAALTTLTPRCKDAVRSGHHDVHPRAAPPRREHLEPGRTSSPGWHDVPLSTTGEAEAAAAGETLATPRACAFDMVHTSLLTPGHPDRRPRPRRPRPALAAGRAVVAAQRAPLRRPPGHGQEADGRASTAPTRSSSGAAPTTCPRRRSSPTTPSIPATTRATPGSPPTCSPAAECLNDVVERVLPYWYDAIVPDLRAGLDGARRRPRQLPAGARQAPRRHLRRRHRRAEHPDRASPAGTSSGPTSRSSRCATSATRAPRRRRPRRSGGRPAEQPTAIRSRRTSR